MADWSGLLRELVFEIAKGITFHEDLINFSNVCSSWQSATSNWDDSQQLPSRFPSLLVLDEEQQQCKIYLMDGTVRKVQLPNSRVICRSSTGGWLIIVEQDTTNAKLVHPLSGRQIDLPDLISLPLDDFIDLEEEFCANRAEVVKLVLSSDPTIEENEQDLIVMIICGGRGWLAFCKPGDSSWTPVQQGWKSRVIDLCYYKGKAYTFDMQGLILCCDLHSVNPALLPVSRNSIIGLEDDLDVDFDHILSPWDENNEKLLVVCHRYVHHPYPGEELNKVAKHLAWMQMSSEYFVCNITQSFWVFECDLETGEWRKVDNLGNRAIFVGLCSSFIMEASDCIKANCIYFTDNTANIRFTEEGRVGKLDMGIYHLSDGSIEPLFDVQALSEYNNPMWIAPPSF